MLPLYSFHRIKFWIQAAAITGFIAVFNHKAVGFAMMPIMQLLGTANQILVLVEQVQTESASVSAECISLPNCLQSVLN